MSSLPRANQLLDPFMLNTDTYFDKILLILDEFIFALLELNVWLRISLSGIGIF